MSVFNPTAAESERAAYKERIASLAAERDAYKLDSDCLQIEYQKRRALEAEVDALRGWKRDAIEVFDIDEHKLSGLADVIRTANAKTAARESPHDG